MSHNEVKFTIVEHLFDWPKRNDVFYVKTSLFKDMEPNCSLQ